MAMVCVENFEKKAAEQLEKYALDYYRSGADEQFSLGLNREAFRRLRLRPRCLRGVSQADIGCEIFGEQMKWPLGIAPTAMQKMAHPDGELGNARAAEQAGSSFSAPSRPHRWRTWPPAHPTPANGFSCTSTKTDSMLTEKMIPRAENSNFKALVLTIDAPINGDRRADARNNFSLPPHLTLANFQGAKAGGIPEVVNAMGHDLVVIPDGGIMQGIDIFKALALGAKTVFVVCVVFLGCIFVSVAYVPRPIFGDASALMKGNRCWRSVLHYMRELGM